MAHKTGLEEYYIIKNNKKMRYGYTTGSSATAAAKAAVKMLLSKEGIAYDAKRDFIKPGDSSYQHRRKPGFLCCKKRWWG